MTRAAHDHECCVACWPDMCIIRDRDFVISTYMHIHNHASLLLKRWHGARARARPGARALPLHAHALDAQIKGFEFMISIDIVQSQSTRFDERERPVHKTTDPGPVFIISISLAYGLMRSQPE